MIAAPPLTIADFGCPDDLRLFSVNEGVVPDSELGKLTIACVQSIRQQRCFVPGCKIRLTDMPRLGAHLKKRHFIEVNDNFTEANVVDIVKRRKLLSAPKLVEDDE